MLNLLEKYWAHATLIVGVILAVVRFLFRWPMWFQQIKDFFDKVDKAQDTVRLVATNHLPHLQASADASLEELRKMNEQTAANHEWMQRLIERVVEQKINE
jgi:hypothetical protein